MTQQALSFLEKHPEIFNGRLERSRETINILQEEINILKKRGKIENLQEPQCKLIGELKKVIKENYEKPQEFNCIYNLYECLVRTLVEVVQEEIKEQDLLEIFEDAKNSEAKEGALFNLDQGENEYTIESVKEFWRSLIFYQDFELTENKTTEAHNLRKASILAQLYLMHRLVVAGVKYEYENSPRNIFSNICLVFAKRYLQLSSVVYDLKGYFPYLDEKFYESLEKEVSGNPKSKFI